MMRHQIVMIRRPATAPVSAISVCAFGVSGILQTLRNHTPLNGKILAAINGKTLINTPTNGAVVYYYITAIHTSKTVTFMICHILIAKTETQEAYYNIVSTDDKGITGNTNAIAGSCLAGYRYVSLI